MRSNRPYVQIDPDVLERARQIDLENFGEEDKFYIRDHHEAIISEEMFEEAQKILAKKSCWI